MLLDGQLLTVRGNERLLRRLLRNLLDNAVRHGEAGSGRASLQRRGADACLSVTDAGPGVAASEAERVFESFYRPPGAAESGQGYGLGLALVRRVARLHRGEARCVADGGGCRFEVVLPLSA